MSNPIFAQISPGDLTKAHADLEGLSNCTKCHDIGKKVSKAKCLTCHEEISDLISKNKGFHSQKNVANKDCWKCHGEHYGRNFKIVNFDKNKFDHIKTGFKLVGKHKDLKCEKCHKKDFILIKKLKNKKNTFLGLSTECKDCHEDVHRQTLGNNCNNCHNEEKFKPAVNFDHNNSKFKLSGKHIDVACEKCHPKEKKDDKSFQKFKNILFTNCGNCHKDPHKTRFGNNCKSCHVTESFNKVNIRGKFNHSKTRFPLLGKHKGVKCENCHKGGIKNKPKFSNCFDCHEDYHKGEFVKNNRLLNCSKCHNESGFSPSLFTIEKHAQTKFKLSFAHKSLPCFECHRKENSWHFKNIETKCISCHSNIHKNFISNDYFDESNCESCHNTKKWNDLNFDHNRTGFKLIGKHLETSCGSCHFKRENSKIVEQRFSNLNNNCTQCHNDIHFGQFIENKKDKCTECHTFNNWEPDLFNHAKTKFALDGAHRKVDCSKCHKTVERDNKKYINYKLGDTSCKSCHSS